MIAINAQGRAADRNTGAGAEAGYPYRDCQRRAGDADHCSNIAVEMLQVAEGKLEAHEYLNALKAGELRESAQYAEQFRTYRAKYAFPEENENE